MAILWITIFLVSMAVMVKGADWLLESAEKIGLAAGLSRFIIGVTIVGIGTSFPEVISALVATFKGVTEIVTANAIGSNIANILLIIGFSAVLGRKLTVTKSLIDIDIPLLAASTVILLGVIWDGQVTFLESALMLLAYVVYLLYTVIHKDEGDIEELQEVLPSRQTRRKHVEENTEPKLKLGVKDFVFLTLGIIGLALGSKYLIDAVIQLSDIFKIGVGVISITAVAIGTSLPELLVSAKAALQKKSEMALGNIFGSNVFNALVVIGLPGMFKTIILDEKTFSIGVPTLILATFLFIVSGISRRIHIWEGAFFLIIYVLFLAKLFNFF